MFTGTSPRYAHTCHRVGKRQLLTSGGQSKNDRQCDWERKAVAILDVPTLAWGSVYNARDNEFELGSYLTDKIGGNGQGGATVKTPEKGWNTPGLGIIMSTTRIYNEDGTPTQPVAAPKWMTTTRMAGIIGGSIAGAVLIGCIAWLIHVYRQNRQTHCELPASISPVETFGDHKFELSPDEKKIWEVSGMECRHEIPDSEIKVEADRFNTVTHAVELPTTNFHKDGRWGVPILRLPSPARLAGSRRGSRAHQDEQDSPKDVRDMV